MDIELALQYGATFEDLTAELQASIAEAEADLEKIRKMAEEKAREEEAQKQREKETRETEIQLAREELVDALWYYGCAMGWIDEDAISDEELEECYDSLHDVLIEIEHRMEIQTLITDLLK